MVVMDHAQLGHCDAMAHHCPQTCSCARVDCKRAHGVPEREKEGERRLPGEFRAAGLIVALSTAPLGCAEYMSTDERATTSTGLRNDVS